MAACPPTRWVERAHSPRCAHRSQGFTMTQATRTSFKCPLLQVDMTEKGELRPVRVHGACSHVFSFKGLTETLKPKRGQGLLQVGNLVRQHRHKA